ncbi:MAG: class I SAM-dependent methyltransferase [Myxococcales bacterium]|nr:class I SAM-dependent methyltransferase [Myxococcales bacterium]
MAKTGDEGSLGTAEGAVMGRAAHALHADPPVLADTWAVYLLDEDTQALVRDPAYADKPMEWGDFDTSPLFALNVGSLRYAEDEVERCVRDGIDQYVILGAGFDTFALRRGDLSDGLRVYEVDHPDVQALKRERIARAKATPVALPTFVPVDFESTRMSDGLEASHFDPRRSSVFSWMNTIPYLSESATKATLREIAALMAPASRIVLNYSCIVPLSDEQSAYLQTLQGKVSQSGEPLKSRFEPQAFEALLTDVGFAIIEHATEQDLYLRYFQGRADGLNPSVPARLIVAERRS